MKKAFLLSFLTLLMIPLSAQFSLRLQSGYGFALGSGVLGFQEAFDMANNQTYEVVRGSYGQGVHLALYSSLRLSEAWLAELGISYLHGQPYAIGFETPNLFASRESRARHWRLLPGLRFLPRGQGLQMTGSLAALIPIGGSLRWVDVRRGANISTEETTTRLRFGFSLGAQGSLGVVWQQARWQVMLECVYQALALTPQRGEVLSLLEDGREQLVTLEPYERELRFFNVIDSSTPTGSSNQPVVPRAFLAEPQPFSQVGLQVGIAWRLAPPSTE
jgi:hypothetical protein